MSLFSTVTALKTVVAAGGLTTDMTDVKIALCITHVVGGHEYLARSVGSFILIQTGC